MSSVAIILLNWNGYGDTIECLESLKGVNYDDFTVYLVDNDSGDDSVEKITEYLDRDKFYEYDILSRLNLDSYHKKSNINLVLILNDSNNGFAGGNNVALKYIMDNDVCDYVLLLNNDTIVSEDFITDLEDEFVEEEETGFVGITHYYYDTHEIQTIGSGLVDTKHGEATAILEDTGLEPDFITGSCIFTSRDVLIDVGLIYEDYFLYWEDVDWSTTAKNKGYMHKTSSKGYICHKEGASIESLNRIYYHTRNRIVYRKRHAKTSTYYHFLVYIILYVMKEITFNLGRTSHNKIMIKALIHGIMKASKTRQLKWGQKR